MALHRAPPLGTSFMGLAWVGPGIIQYGTDEQKRRFVPDILDSRVNWCTGYSEPNHGSDLAAIQTKAERVGDNYVVNGQKIWTTGAPWADWIILLTRTQFDVERKHDGITCLLVPMDSPGVDVRPIENMAGERNFAEVFFTDVEVPVGNRLGEEGKGWQVTISALANERSSIGEVTQMFARLDALKDLVKTTDRQGKPAAQDPTVQRRIGEFEAKIAAMKYNGLRYLTKQLRGEPLSSETSVNKLHRASLEIEMADFAVELTGMAGVQLGGDHAAGGRQLGAFIARLAERGDRRRHAEHSAQHHRRAHSGVAEGLSANANRLPAIRSRKLRILARHLRGTEADRQRFDASHSPPAFQNLAQLQGVGGSSRPAGSTPNRFVRDCSSGGRRRPCDGPCWPKPSSTARGRRFKQTSALHPRPTSGGRGRPCGVPCWPILPLRACR